MNVEFLERFAPKAAACSINSEKVYVDVGQEWEFEGDCIRHFDRNCRFRKDELLFMAAVLLEMAKDMEE